ncbi:secreted RxLR effector protein 161-like [Solenopsis invicta]|uniref:secreted RxLR effector protein 161-like n=1 Tax=Solenopsis invicta TaxID=13686 RepID=UPI00193C8901|nr:secreted RxLR effector protein 161-like [Solenopsis invicta]
MFLATVTRPDIAFAVGKVSAFLNNHDVNHWNAVKRIIRYLLNTVDRGVLYESGGSNEEIEGYVDADFAEDLETRRSTTGYVFLLGNGAVTWTAQRQKMVTISTTEAEYVAAAAAAKEAIWLRRLLSGLERNCNRATKVFIDNQSTLRLVQNSEFHKRTKHIDVRCHFIREKVLSGKIDTKCVNTTKQKADLFTKALPRDRFKALCQLINLIERNMCSNGGSVA